VGKVWRLIVVAAAAAAGACSEARKSEIGDPRWTTYAETTAAILASNCHPCHSDAVASGGYSIDSYLSAVARRDDGTPRVVAGDPDSALLAAARGERAGHVRVSEDDLQKLQDWTVRSRLAPKPYRVHEKGWMNPGDTSAFHGLALRRLAYDNATCQSCHGQDLRGGVSGVDCQSCHTNGVQACNTCHGDATSPAPPRDLHGIRVTTALGVGAHRSHVQNGSLHAAYNCNVCHATPSTPAHYANYGHPDEPPADVTVRSAFGLIASWDRDSATCSNSYCHRPSQPQDPRPRNTTPHWTRVGSGEASCGTCHGLPPASHVDNRCPACHQASYSQSALVAARHANGVVDLGTGPDGCSNCHGDQTSPAPPKDVLGRTDERLQTVGAHRAHLEARHQLRGPIACNECHAVPADLHDPGHIDHLPPAIVFPSAAGVGVLASTDGARPTYNSSSATCGSVYCHGSGTRAERDTAPTVNRTPSWIGSTSQAACGTCHGIPPNNGVHPAADLTQCVNCHSATVTSDGAIRVDRDPITHINGVVDFN